MRPGRRIVGELSGFIKAGEWVPFIILSLLLALMWVTAQWRKSEAGRIEDLKTIVALGVEVKNNIATLVELVKGDRRDR